MSDQTTMDSILSLLGGMPERREEKADWLMAAADLAEERGEESMAAEYRLRSAARQAFPRGVIISCLTPEGEVRYWGGEWVIARYLACVFSAHWEPTLETVRVRFPDYFIVLEPAPVPG